MSPFARSFKRIAVDAADRSRLGVSAAIGRAGLNDFVTNGIKDNDDPATIAVKALLFFCDDQDPNSDVAEFAMVAVQAFLDDQSGPAAGQRSSSAQCLADLYRLLARKLALGLKPDETEIRKWIAANFRV